MPDCFMEKRTPFRKQFQYYESEAMWEDVRGHIGYKKYWILSRNQWSVICILEISLCSVDNIWKENTIGGSGINWENFGWFREEIIMLERRQ